MSIKSARTPSRTAVLAAGVLSASTVLAVTFAQAAGAQPAATAPDRAVSSPRPEHIAMDFESRGNVDLPTRVTASGPVAGRCCSSFWPVTTPSPARRSGDHVQQNVLSCRTARVELCAMRPSRVPAS
jgi:hypothetical protein